MALSKIVENSLADSAVSSAKLKDFAAAVDLNGVELVLDADADTSITADTDDRIDFKIANVEHFSFSNSSGDTIVKPMVDAKDIKFQQYDGRTLLDINDGGFVGIENGATGPGAIRIFEDTDNGSNYVGLSVGNVSTSYTLVFPNADGSSGQVMTTNGSGVLSFADASANTPSSADGQALGSASLEWSDLFLADAGTIQFGNDQDVILTHVADTGLLLSGTNVIQFNDASQNIGAPSATVLDINATDEIELNATLVDVNANLDVSGTIVGASTLSATTGTFSGILKTDDATEATSTTDGSLQTDGGLSVVKDIVAGDDIKLLSDASVIHFGTNSEITLTHVHDSGLALKHTATADDKPVNLILQTGETDMAANDVIGKISFQAPDEGTGTDAILVSGAIQAIAEGDHSSSSNATSLQFMTGASEAATAKMTINSAGKVGIGTTTMTRTFNITDTTGGASTGIQLIGANDGTQFINFGDTDDSNVGEINYDHSTNKMLFRANDAYEMAIFNGVVGMGANASSADLGVGLHIKTADSGAAVEANADELVVEGSGNTGITILSGTSNVGAIHMNDSGGNERGALKYNHAADDLQIKTAGAEKMRIESAGTVEIKSASSGLVPFLKFENAAGDTTYGIVGAEQANNAVIGSGDTGLKIDAANDIIRPYTITGTGGRDNAIDLGSGSHRYQVVYAGTGAINTSDERLKNNIADTDLGLDFINKLKPKKYKLNDGKSDRIHYGLISQDVETVLGDISKATKDFAGFIKTDISADNKDDLDKVTKLIDDNVDPLTGEAYTSDKLKILQDRKTEIENKNDDIYALRYEEFISPIIKAIQELSAKVKTLEDA